MGKRNIQIRKIFIVLDRHIEADLVSSHLPGTTLTIEDIQNLHAWLCKCLEEREEEAHLLSGTCKVYGDIARKYDDIMDDENLVQLFSEILARRDQLDKEN